MWITEDSMKIEPTKKYILELRKALMHQVKNEGHDNIVIAQIFNIDTSAVSRILRFGKNMEVSKHRIEKKP